MKKSHVYFAVLFFAVLIAGLTGCGSLGSLMRQSLAKGPVPNHIFLHADPAVGDFAQHSTAVIHSGKVHSTTKTEFRIVEKRGELFVVRFSILESTENFTRDNVVGKMAFSYLVDARGRVQQAWYHDLYEETKSDIPVFQKGQEGYVRWKRIPVTGEPTYTIGSTAYRIRKVYRRVYRDNNTSLVSITGIDPAVKFGIVAQAVVTEDKAGDDADPVSLLLRSMQPFKGMENRIQLTAQGNR